MRKIIHIDMDAFFASVEERDDPALKSHPIAVGGGEERGVITTANYKARKFGVKSAMSGGLARKLCPHIVFVPIRYAKYKEVSQQIREVFFSYTDLVEPLSLDEAFLDVTENKKDCPSAMFLANEIRRDIYAKTGLTASAGIANTKFLAKIASDIDKPNGQTTILPDEAFDFISKLKIEKFFGIGPKTAQRMKDQGILTGADLQSWTLDDLLRTFKNQGRYFYNIARNQDDRAVEPNQERKSVGVEHTYREDLSNFGIIQTKLREVTTESWERFQRAKKKSKTITLKIKYSDFTFQTRSFSNPLNWSSEGEVQLAILKLLQKSELPKPIRLLGVTFSNFETEEMKPKHPDQQSLF